MAEELRILVAAPSEVLRRTVCAQVRNRGLGVTSEVSTDAEARERLGNDAYDLVLLDDALLPVVSWIREREEFQGLPVIVIAHDDSSEWFSEAVRAGASDYLVVPYRPSHLVSKISRVRESEAVLMPNIYGKSDLQELRAAVDPAVLGQDEIDALLTASRHTRGGDGPVDGRGRRGSCGQGAGGAR